MGKMQTKPSRDVPAEVRKRLRQVLGEYYAAASFVDGSSTIQTVRCGEGEGDKRFSAYLVIGPHEEEMDGYLDDVSRQTEGYFDHVALWNALSAAGRDARGQG